VHDARAMDKRSTKTKSTAASARRSVVRSAATGRFLSTRQDVEEFEAAACAYVKEHTKTQAAARAALRKMGMITAAGRATKRYS
jgi:hypothetical protein